MATLLRLCLLYAAFVIAFVKSDEQTSSPDKEILEPAESNNGLVGVASVAGIISRNSRVSSLGGIQIYPGLDPITITNTDGGYFYPLTVTKESDGNFASGSIQLLQGYPGSIVVTSAARSGYGPDMKPLPPLPLNLNKPYGPDMKLPVNFNSQLPILKEFLIQPLPDLYEKTRTADPEPWFLKNVLPYNSRSDGAESNWFYPNFNPFMNFWR